ncbi:MAG: hypothetical protein J6Y28_04225 [Acholeplasmatales bacterium]|nr:hypothetical protein [Methanobrevibacter sp.]MBP5445360.1 hypothetical protein [Acholeplasmatales bacterium]
MATSTITFDRGSINFGISKTSFGDIIVGNGNFSSYARTALTNIDSAVSTASDYSGIITVGSGGGPAYGIMYWKYSNTNYAGIFFSYSMTEVLSFNKSGDTYSLKQLG